MARVAYSRHMTTPIDSFDLDDFVRRVLAEDLGSGGDVTSNATIAGTPVFQRASMPEALLLWARRFRPPPHRFSPVFLSSRVIRSIEIRRATATARART